MLESKETTNITHHQPLVLGETLKSGTDHLIRQRTSWELSWRKPIVSTFRQRPKLSQSVFLSSTVIQTLNRSMNSLNAAFNLSINFALLVSVSPTVYNWLWLFCGEAASTTSKVIIYFSFISSSQIGIESNRNNAEDYDFDMQRGTSYGIDAFTLSESLRL